MSYTSNVKAEGFVAPEVGIQQNVRLENVKFENNRLTFFFRQENGALVTHSEFEPNTSFDVEVQQTDTSRRVKHIANETGIELNIEDTDSFESYVNQIVESFKNPQYTVSAIFIYNKKGFVCLPKFPLFVERTKEDGSTTLKINKYNESKLIKPEPDPEPIEENTEKDPLPF